MRWLSLLLLLASCAGPRYSYKESRQAERDHNQNVRYYRNLNRQEARQHDRQLRHPKPHLTSPL